MSAVSRPARTLLYIICRAICGSCRCTLVVLFPVVRSAVGDLWHAKCSHCSMRMRRLLHVARGSSCGDRVRNKASQLSQEKSALPVEFS